MTISQIKKKIPMARKMAQWLRCLAGLPEDLGSIPSSHMDAHNSV